MFNILVVEDDTNTRRLMCAVLERYGYHSIPATDGVDALEQMEKKHVDLVILDIMMPKMDGYEFTRILREGGNTLPILMVTAKETPADKHKGFIIGDKGGEVGHSTDADEDQARVDAQLNAQIEQVKETAVVEDHTVVDLLGDEEFQMVKSRAGKVSEKHTDGDGKQE